MEFEKLIINFKSAELRELEQLAKAAGIISVNDFAKERLLSLLAAQKEDQTKLPESRAQLVDAPTEDVIIDSEKWQQLIFELSRLHQELRVFAKESSVSLDGEAEKKEAELVLATDEAAGPSSAIEPSSDQWQSTSPEETKASADPLDDLLEKALLKVQERNPAKQVVPENIKGAAKVADSPESKIEQTEAFDGTIDAPVDQAANESQQSVSSQSDQTVKETAADRSGGFPPKKRR